MKMKKWIAFTAALGMAVGTMAMVACGDKGDETPKNVEYTITIVDQDGDVVSGATFDVFDGETTVTTLTTDANGVASATLPEGDYTLSYTELPSEWYDDDPETAGIDIVTDFSVSVDDADVELVVSNWTPGTSLNAYTCYYETDEETEETSAAMHVEPVKANSDNYYLVARAGDRIICVERADVTIIYNGVSYSAKDGDIEIQSQAPVAGDLNYWALFQIINETDSDIQLVMTFKEVPAEEGDGSVEEGSSEEVTA